MQGETPCNFNGFHIGVIKAKKFADELTFAHEKKEKATSFRTQISYSGTQVIDTENVKRPFSSKQRKSWVTFFYAKKLEVTLYQRIKLYLHPGHLINFMTVTAYKGTNEQPIRFRYTRPDDSAIETRNAKLPTCIMIREGTEVQTKLIGEASFCS